MRILVTGVYGFIGSNFARMVLNNTDHTVVGFARDTEQLGKLRIADLRDNPRFQIIHGDLASDISGLLERIDVVVNFAAKTFVDHSIRDPEPFVRNNITGTYNLLEQARMYSAVRRIRFVQISTDEVYGSILEGAHTESSPLNPTNPYSASKAAADMLVNSYHHSYGLDTIITRTENNYGPWQHPQKVIPVFAAKASRGEEFPLYGDGMHRRMWLHVEDHCSAILMLVEKGVSGEIYHVAGDEEMTNVDLAKTILETLGKPEGLITFIDDSKIRPGHDRRYALDSSKTRSLGWSPKYSSKEGIVQTVRWFNENQWWTN